MKFEKFLKGCGTHGLVLERSNGDKWLICAGVGMLVPNGVVNLLGAGEVSEKTKNIVEALVRADTDDRVMLKRATIPADGKASNIIRVFGSIDDLSEQIEIGIYNVDFGLLEKADINLAEVEIEESDKVFKYLLVLNRDKEVIGFIEGVNNI